MRPRHYSSRNICFRSLSGSQSLLIFPELVNLKRPRVDVTESVDDVSYNVIGAVENVYATLVVLLGYTNLFISINQWKNQAEFEATGGAICGLRQVAEREGEIEFVLYYATSVEPPTKQVFQGLFERLLSQCPVVATRYPVVVCPACRYRQERVEIVRRIQQKHGFLFCSNCGTKVDLPGSGEPARLTGEQHDDVETEQATARLRTHFEAALVQVKARSTLTPARPPRNVVSSAIAAISPSRSDGSNSGWRRTSGMPGSKSFCIGGTIRTTSILPRLPGRSWAAARSSSSAARCTARAGQHANPVPVDELCSWASKMP